MMRSALATAALLLIARVAFGQADSAPVPGWLPDLPSGFAEAKRTGKPLLVVFR